MSNDMRAYQFSMFLIFVNFGIIIMNASLLFPDTTAATADYKFSSLYNMLTIFTTTDGIVDKAKAVLTFAALALFAFSLLIFAIPFMGGLFFISTVISDVLIGSLPIDGVWKAPLVAGVTIIYYVGYAQFISRSTLQGS